MFYENDFICCLSASYNEVRNMSKLSNTENKERRSVDARRRYAERILC